MDNAAWLRALADAESAAYGELRVQLVARLRPVLARRGVSEDLAEDFVHEALVRIRACLEQFRGESSFVAWATSIAIRVAFTELRRVKWRDVSFEAFTHDAATPLGAPDPETTTQDRALARARVLGALREAIADQLTERQRCVLVAELRGMPHTEIARHLGIHRNALYKLSHDARRKVRSALASAGIDETDVLWAFE